MRQLVPRVLAGALLLGLHGVAPLAAAPTHAFQVPEGKYLGLEIPEGLAVEARLGIDQVLEIDIRPPDGSYEIVIATLPTLWPHPDDEHEGTWIRDWIPRVARTEFQKSGEVNNSI